MLRTEMCNNIDIRRKIKMLKNQIQLQRFKKM